MHNLTAIVSGILLVILVVALLPDLATAQPPPPMPAKPTQNPIDGGLALLAAAGGAYAIKKLREK